MRGSPYKLAGILALTVVFGGMCAGAELRAGRPVLQKTKRIVFLGDSITWDGRYVADVMAWLSLRYPKRTFEVVNVGLSSETVSGLSEEGHANGEFPRPYIHDRLARILEKTKPDLVFACYGMNCGIYQPFDEDRFAKYREGMTRLHDAVEATGAKVVFMTPPVYDAKQVAAPADGYNDVLGRYSDWLLSQSKRGWRVIDLHRVMNAELAKRRALNPAFTFQPDGVHPDDAGHWFMARQIIRYLGDRESAKAESVEALPHGGELAALARERMSIVRDAWLGFTGHTRPGLPAGISVEDAMEADATFASRMQTLVGSKRPSSKPVRGRYVR